MSLGDPMADDAGKCLRCGHDFDPHVVAVTVFLPVTLTDGTVREDCPAGGWIYCDEDGCDCHVTWSAEGWGFTRAEGWGFTRAVVEPLIDAWEVFLARSGMA